MYVTSSPTRKIDPTGTCDYEGKCTYIAGGNIVGGGTLVCSFRTKCKDNKYEIGQTKTAFIGSTVGLYYAGMTSFAVCFNSYNSDVSFQNLYGFSAIASAGFATPFFGYSFTALRLGGASGNISGLQKGMDAPSADFFIGETMPKGPVKSKKCCNDNERDELEFPL